MTAPPTTRTQEATLNATLMRVLRGGLAATLIAALAGPLTAAAATARSTGGTPGAERAIGAYPTELDFGELARGTESLAALGVINGGDTQAEFTFEALGEVAPWIRFVDPTRPEVQLGTLDVTARSDAQIGVLLAVPAGTPNGTYAGSVRVVGEPQAPADRGASPVQVAIDTPVRLTVDSTQVVAGTLVDVDVTRLLEVGMPLRVRSTIENTGNVLMTPRVDLSVFAKDRVVERVQQSDTRVEPGANGTVELDWDTSGLDPGDYEAAVAVDASGIALGDRRVPFELVPRGTLTRDGRLDDLDVADGVEAGGLTRIEGTFENTGEVEVAAALRAEVSIDGVLSDEATGDPVIVPPGGRGKLEVLVPTDRNGAYRIAGLAVFDGERTDARELRFTVGGSSFPRVAVLAAALAAALLGVLAWRRRRRRTRVAERPATRPATRAAATRRPPAKVNGSRAATATAVFTVEARGAGAPGELQLYEDRLEFTPRSSRGGSGKRSGIRVQRLDTLTHVRSSVGRKHTTLLLGSGADSLELRLARRDAQRLRAELNRLRSGGAPGSEPGSELAEVGSSPES